LSRFTLSAAMSAIDTPLRVVTLSTLISCPDRPCAPATPWLVGKRRSYRQRERPVLRHTVAALGRGLSVDPALRCERALCALTCTPLGAQAGVPMHDSLERLLRHGTPAPIFPTGRSQITQEPHQHV
jgi:hypothetical protein